jgi:hypothetical protein
VLVQRGYRGRGPATLHDALSGEQLALLAPRSDLRWRRARFLADGRIAMLVRRGGGVALRLVAPDGGSLGDLPLGPGDGGWVGGEWRAGHLPVTVVLRDRATGRPVSEVRELDLATGAVHRLAGVPAWVSPVDIDSTLAVGAPATRLFWGPTDGRLLSIDPATGAPRALLPR